MSRIVPDIAYHFIFSRLDPQRISKAENRLCQM
jgi:hypothetical protein